jgi:hypothetical protein
MHWPENSGLVQGVSRAGRAFRLSMKICSR